MEEDQTPQTSAGDQPADESLLTVAPWPCRSPRQHSSNYRRQMLMNHMMLLDAAEQDGSGEAYEEMKRLIIFAGIFFLFIIIFILLKFQVSLDDVFKWSPVVWLVGVIICGVLMNVFIHLQKYIKRRRTKRLQEQDLLFSLHLPTSFPCLAPPPHTEACCRCGGALFASPPSPAALLGAQRNHQRYQDALSPSTSTDVYADQLEQHLLAEYGLLVSFSEQQRSFIPRLPTYEQVMNGAKTWLLSKTAYTPSSPTEQRQDIRHPPEYMPPLVATDIAGPSSFERRVLSPLHVDVDEEVSGEASRSNSTNHQPRALLQKPQKLTNIPPPAYDESVSVAESVRLMSPQLAQLNDIENGRRMSSDSQRERTIITQPVIPPIIDRDRTVERSTNGSSSSTVIELAIPPMK